MGGTKGLSVHPALKQSGWYASYNMIVHCARQAHTGYSMYYCACVHCISVCAPLLCAGGSHAAIGNGPGATHSNMQGRAHQAGLLHRERPPRPFPHAAPQRAHGLAPGAGLATQIHSLCNTRHRHAAAGVTRAAGCLDRSLGRCTGALVLRW